MAQTLKSAHSAQGPSDSIVDAARRVLKIEEAALARLAAELPPDLTGAVQLMLRAEGRVIVSGIGKSGQQKRTIKIKRNKKSITKKKENQKRTR